MKTKLFSLVALVPLFAFSQYNNGGLSTGPTAKNGTAAPAGYTWSEVQNNTGNNTESNTTAGYTAALFGTANYFLADDFIIPAGQSWQISTIEVFAYQTGFTGSTSPFNVLRLSILNGNPSVSGSSVVFGDDTTNRMSGSADGLMYRIFNTMVPTPAATTTTRKIWKLTGNAPVTLNAGTYWMKYQIQSAVTTNGGFTPPVTIVGSRGLSTFNAMQYDGTNAVWNALVDDGNPTTAPDYTMDLPFIVNYTVLGTNENVQFDNRVVVYPNPVKDVFKLNLPAESQRVGTTVSVYDMSGKLVKTMPYDESYNVAELAKGSYMLKVNDGSNKKVVKMIKQ